MLDKSANRLPHPNSSLPSPQSFSKLHAFEVSIHLWLLHPNLLSQAICVKKNQMQPCHIQQHEHNTRVHACSLLTYISYPCGNILGKITIYCGSGNTTLILHTTENTYTCSRLCNVYSTHEYVHCTCV